jgi:hypothetical protein
VVVEAERNRMRAAVMVVLLVAGSAVLSGCMSYYPDTYKAVTDINADGMPDFRVSAGWVVSKNALTVCRGGAMKSYLAGATSAHPSRWAMLYIRPLSDSSLVIDRNSRFVFGFPDGSTMRSTGRFAAESRDREQVYVNEIRIIQGNEYYSTDSGSVLVCIELETVPPSVRVVEETEGCWAWFEPVPTSVQLVATEDGDQLVTEFMDE